MLNVGDQAPDIRVQTDSGESFQLSAMKGKRVVLFFYPKADTPGCTIESCGFKDLYPKFEERGIAILGCSFDTVEENAAFAKKFDLPYPLLCDVDREIGLAYGACDEPNAGYADRITYVIDEDGFISQAFSHVETRTHPAKLLEALPPSPSA
jgi:peroxiredoxin Q/BCP